MSKKIKVVIGANFGDEGKGLMTDYFCHKLSEDSPVLNVRHNGGFQAGHTVVTPDGNRHVFNGFGAGSFNPHVATYFSSTFILNPIMFCRELDAIHSLGLNPVVHINPLCRITTPYDMMLNQIAETVRGENRHGSCGLGINETVFRNNCGRTLFAGLLSTYPKRSLASHLAAILVYWRKTYYPERLYQLGIRKIPNEYKDKLNDNRIIAHWIEDVMKMMDNCHIQDDTLLYSYNNIVFEGAQGLLLDTDYKAFAPHLTTSKTGSYNPKNILIRTDLTDEDIEICYVTRSYFTRHGAGPFPSECKKEEILDEGCVDKTNHYNEFQGEFRYGIFDSGLFNETVRNDIKYCHKAFSHLKNTIAVTHLDETSGHLVIPNAKVKPEMIGDKVYACFGETRDCVKEPE